VYDEILRDVSAWVDGLTDDGGVEHLTAHLTAEVFQWSE
jgi:hypothetical protein